MNCEMKLSNRKPSRYDYATLHHVIPKSKGGKWSMDNIVLCCKECNWAFDNHWPPLWLVWDLAERMYRWRRRDRGGEPDYGVTNGL